MIGSHGNLISLILQALEPDVGYDFHMAMPMPAKRNRAAITTSIMFMMKAIGPTLRKW